MFGLSKIFIIFVILSLIIGYGTENWMNAFWFIFWFAIIRTGWRILT